jgi:hypothetical protein
MIGGKRESAFVTQKKSRAFNEMLGMAWSIPAHPRLEYSIRNGIGEANDQKAEEQDQERLFSLNSDEYRRHDYSWYYPVAAFGNELEKGVKHRICQGRVQEEKQRGIPLKQFINHSGSELFPFPSCRQC